MLSSKSHLILMSMALECISTDQNPVIGFSETRNTIEYYGSIKDAEKKYKDLNHMIYQSCNDSKLKAFGLEWAFLFAK